VAGAETGDDAGLGKEYYIVEKNGLFHALTDGGATRNSKDQEKEREGKPQQKNCTIEN